MKKQALFVGTALLFAASAFAQQTPEKPKSAQRTEVKCPVMPNAKVDVKKATEKKMYADYKGNRYFFCCAGCPGPFKKDPEKYAKSDHIPTPAQDTTKAAKRKG